MKKLVVYTCVTGGYEKVAEPLALSEGVDFVCYTDNHELCGSDGGVWQYRMVDHLCSGASRTSRYYKMHPSDLFPDYEYSLWIDGNVTIADEALYSRLYEMMDYGSLAAGLRHPDRDDIYEEAYRILYGRREKLHEVMRTVRFLKRSGMPPHFGLYENNVILRRHSDPKVKEFDDLWWECLRDYSGRDQLSHTYAIWKTGIKYDLILPDGTNARNNPCFRYTGHGPQYRKKRSLKGVLTDASTFFNKCVYKIWLVVSAPR